MKRHNVFYLWLSWLIGNLSVHDGSLCEFSRRYWDIHDYPADKGGNGHPHHLIIYRCPNCGKDFMI